MSRSISQMRIGEQLIILLTQILRESNQVSREEKQE